MQKIPVRQIETLCGRDQAWPINIRDVDKLLSGRDLTGDLHRHDFFYILALKKGKGTHEIDFTTHTISANSLFIIRPGQVHRIMLKAGATGYLLSFHGDFYAQDHSSNQLLRKSSCENFYKLKDDAFDQILLLLDAIHEEHSEKQSGYMEMIKANLTILLTKLARESSCAKSGQDSSHLQERLDQFRALVAKHVVNYKQPSDYADMLNISPYQLNAITKATLGKTSSEAINDYIILESKRHLLGTTNQVTQIASHLGYEDVSYFIRFFKKHTGLSPEAFRQNFR